MAAAKREKRGSTRGDPEASEVLGKLTSAEAASVLQNLLQRHPELCSEAETLAVEVLDDVSPFPVADDLEDSILLLGFGELNARAGKRAWGYVEPGEAAWELLEEKVEPFQQDMKRHLGLGFVEPARNVCQGILLGLYHLRTGRENPVLNYADDFSAEAAGLLLREWRDLSGAAPVSSDFVEHHIPEWKWVLDAGKKLR